MGEIASFSAAYAERFDSHNAATAEQALFAAIMRVNDGYSIASQHCGPADFMDGFHGRMFAAMGEILAQGKAIDPLTLYFAMKNDAALTDQERRKYFVDLRMIPVGYHPAMIVDYSVAIRKYSRQRRMQMMADDILANPDAIPASEMAAALQSLAGSASSGRDPRHLADLSVNAVEQAQVAANSGGAMIGIPTGLIELDNILGGLAKSDLCIVAGRPSMGKTVLGVNIGVNAARERFKVALFSLEMSGEQLAMRFLAGETGIATDNMRRGSLNDDDFEALNDAKAAARDLPLFVEDKPALTVSEIRMAAERVKQAHGLDLIIVDYLGLVRPDKQRESRVVDITEVSAGLKAIAKQLNVPVIALAQLNRGLEQREEKKPLLSDLRDSGAIEQDADQVIFVHRDEYYLERTEPGDDSKRPAWQAKLNAARGLADLIVAKNRHGRAGGAKVRFNAERQRFENLQRGY